MTIDTAQTKQFEGISPQIIEGRDEFVYVSCMETPRPIRKTRSITFSAAPDMDGELRRLANNKQVPIARVVDSLLRAGLQQKSIHDTQHAVAERLERVLARLESASPPNPEKWVDPQAELVLVGCAVAGYPAATYWLQYLRPDIFVYERHQWIWRRIRRAPMPIRKLERSEAERFDYSMASTTEYASVLATAASDNVDQVPAAVQRIVAAAIARQAEPNADVIACAPASFAKSFTSLFGRQP